MNFKNNPIVENPFILKLTTNHTACSYGIPVLVDEFGTAFGKKDVVETGETGEEFVRRLGLEHKGRMGRRTPQHAPDRIEALDFDIDASDWDPMDLVKTPSIISRFLS
jgi:hypothetical protein